MIDFNTISNLYFLGIGGIGMSALARYANAMGKNVAGYDLTASALTQKLEAEGIAVHYTDDINQLPNSFEPTNTLVVRTPAVPDNLNELRALQSRSFKMVKRSELLGMLTNNHFCIAVAGTHGKTSVSTMITHLLHQSGNQAGAFLGGISNNFESNLVLPGPECNLVVTEADEYDRSFLFLHPSISVVTAVDPDHLDIYGTFDKLREAFASFVCNTVPDGKVLFHKRVNLMHLMPCNINPLYYSVNSKADFYISKLKIENGHYRFDFHTPYMIINNVEMHYPGRVNLENMVGAASAAILAGADPMGVCKAMATFKGVERRFDVRLKTDQIVYIDDYAHHPRELEATINSVKELFDGKKVCGIFQPHLFSRTNDFAEGFAASLDLLDKAVILDIYPAREEPMPGVTSKMIFDLMKLESKLLLSIDQIPQYISDNDFEVLLTLGAGNIDRLVEPITELLTSKIKRQ